MPFVTYDPFLYHVHHILYVKYNEARNNKISELSSWKVFLFHINNSVFLLNFLLRIYKITDKVDYDTVFRINYRCYKL